MEKPMSDFPKLEPILPAFIEALNKMTADYYRKELTATYEAGWVPTFSVEPGKKYVRIVVGKNIPGHGSVYCFLDADGNILKAEGYKKPAKGIRGSIFDPNFSLGKGLGRHGAVYWR